ncbi:MAG: aminopeptidase [Leptotrichiaceae bacterium]|nr:aminopeptidase [Leptotrichiaceae bacterium]
MLKVNHTKLFMENLDLKLEKYAQVIVKVGANVQQDQKVWINCTTDSLPLVYKITEEAYKLGASDVHVKLSDDRLSRMHAEYQSTEVYSHVPQWAVDERNDYLDSNVVFIHILSSSPNLLGGIEPEKLGAYAKNVGEAFKYYRSRVMTDANSWTIASYPSPDWAKLVFPEENNIEKAQEKLLDAILKTVRVDKEDPVKAWEEHHKILSEKADYLNKKKFRALHYKATGTDLTVGLPKNHVWIAAGSKNLKGTDFMPNMPTEEVFTAADKYRIDGYVSNKKPLSYQGNIIDNFKLTFKDGKVTDFEAEIGYDILKQLLETDEGAKSIGEVALVPHDSPISNSGLLYYQTLFDENASNHLALGAAYPTNVEGGKEMNEEELEEAHLNQSITHVDFMIGDAEMDIDGINEDGTREPVFRKGNWAF